jgi:hypothetical protein
MRLQRGRPNATATEAEEFRHEEGCFLEKERCTDMTTVINQVETEQVPT